MDLKDHIRTIPDYPKPGIMFRDVTTLFGDAEAFAESVRALSAPFAGGGVTHVAGVEARGFILGGAVAVALEAGFVPLRKKGKLPHKVLTESYDLEYGDDELEMHSDAVPEGANVLLIDDLIATGGTAEAAARLLRRTSARMEAAAFLIELAELGGRGRLEAQDIAVTTLVTFEGH